MEWMEWNECLARALTMIKVCKRGQEREDRKKTGIKCQLRRLLSATNSAHLNVTFGIARLLKNQQ